MLLRNAVLVIATLLIIFTVLGAVVIDLYLSKDNIVVSGKAGVSFLPATTIQTIESLDTQTGISIAFDFHFTPQNLLTGYL